MSEWELIVDDEEVPVAEAEIIAHDEVNGVVIPPSQSDAGRDDWWNPGHGNLDGNAMDPEEKWWAIDEDYHWYRKDKWSWDPWDHTEYGGPNYGDPTYATGR
eukprot:14672531-Heterocapsa_arctica.AAC.1